MASTVFGTITAKAPNPVATPFPPRNFSQMGNMWPTMAMKRGQTQQDGLAWEEDAGEGHCRQSFGASSSSVSIPKAGEVRETFVAPMLPLPRLADVLLAKDADQKVAKGDRA